MSPHTQLAEEPRRQRLLCHHGHLTSQIMKPRHSEDESLIQSHMADSGRAGIWTQIVVYLICGANWYTWSFLGLETVVSFVTPQRTAGYTQHLEKHLYCVPADWWLLNNHRHSFWELAKNEKWTRQERFMPVILELGRWRQEEQELKVISYLWNWGQPGLQENLTLKKQPIKWKGWNQKYEKAQRTANIAMPYSDTTSSVCPAWHWLVTVGEKQLHFSFQQKNGHGVAGPSLPQVGKYLGRWRQKLLEERVLSGPYSLSSRFGLRNAAGNHVIWGQCGPQSETPQTK